MRITAEIPVKKYLVGFLTQEFGEECTVNAHSPIARILFTYLHVRDKALLPKITEDYTFYKIHIPVRFFVHHRVSTISETGMWEVSDWMEDYFNRIMMEYVVSRLDLKKKEEINKILVNKQKKTLIQIQDSIIDFLKKNNISEENMTPDALLKRFERIRNKRKLLV